jgi:hypothetical protein
MTHKQRCKGEYTDQELLDEYFSTYIEYYRGEKLMEHQMCSKERKDEIISILGIEKINNERVRRRNSAKEKKQEDRLLDLERDVKKLRKKFPKLFR